jgi:hypothetical protein
MVVREQEVPGADMLWFRSDAIRGMERNGYPRNIEDIEEECEEYSWRPALFC